jgi:ABC-2 type transport system permease protein
MFLTTVAKLLKITYHIKKHSLLGAMEYKFSFISRILGMLINDILLISIWTIFFARFPTVNGWTYIDTMQVMAISVTSFSLVHIIVPGTNRLSEEITKGNLDYYLTFPQSVLWHVIVMGIDISTIGDLLFGIFLVAWYVPVSGIPLFLVAIISATLIMFAVLLIYHSLTFYLGKFEEAAAQGQEAILSTGMYPQTAFKGVLKIALMTVVPAFFVNTLPQRMFANFTWSDLGFLLAVVVLLNTIAITLFYRGLKRYESGNMFQVRI